MTLLGLSRAILDALSRRPRRAVVLLLDNPAPHAHGPSVTRAGNHVGIAPAVRGASDLQPIGDAVSNLAVDDLRVLDGSTASGEHRQKGGQSEHVFHEATIATISRDVNRDCFRQPSLTRTRAIHALRVATLAGIYILLLLVAAGVVEAQSPTEVEALARVCVGEAGFDADETGDCTAIVLTLRRRAIRRHVSLVRMAAMYSSRHFDEARDDARAWVADLTLAARRPSGWPQHLHWPRYRRGWIAVMRHVRAVLRGEVDDPCPGADHWGMRHGVDWERAQRAGWQEVQCGPTRNAFWDAGGGPS